MMKTGMSRPLDPLGRVVIPKEIRDSLNLTTGVRLDIGVADDCVILRRSEAFCARCGNTSPHMLCHGGVAICRDCIGKFREVNDKEVNINE